MTKILNRSVITGESRLLRSICILLMAVLLVSVSFDGVSAASLNYSIKFKIEGSGALYFDVGPKMEACHVDSPKVFSEKCSITSGNTYSLSPLVSRGLIPVAGKNCRFVGFYDSDGKRLKLTSTKMDILRVKVGGTYVYTHYPAFDNAPMTTITKPLYGEMVKNYVKALYNTTSFSVVGQDIVYSLPRKSQTITARFVEKNIPDLVFCDTLKKTFGDSDFLVAGKIPYGMTPRFSSSNSMVVSVDKATGLASIKGTGIARITVKTPETDLYQSNVETLKLYVFPKRITGLSATKTQARLSSGTSGGTVKVVWDSDSRCSGYVIELSSKSDFSKIILRSKSGKSSSKSKVFKLKASEYKACRYVRIRGYKNSCGETLYGKYTKVRIR